MTVQVPGAPQTEYGKGARSGGFRTPDIGTPPDRGLDTGWGCT